MWLFLGNDTNPDPMLLRSHLDVLLLATALNETLDTNYIFYCARAENATNRENLIGVLSENDYSLGGSP